MPDMQESVRDIGRTVRNNPWIFIAGGGALVAVLLMRGRSAPAPAMQSQVDNTVLPDANSGNGRGAIAGMGMLPEWTLDGRGVRLASGEESVEIEPENAGLSVWQGLLQSIAVQFGRGRDVSISLPGGTVDITTPNLPPAEPSPTGGPIPAPIAGPVPPPPGTGGPIIGTVTKPVVTRPPAWMPGIIDDTPPVDYIPVPSLPSPTPVSAWQSLRDYLAAMTTSTDQSSFIGRVRSGLWTAQSSHIGSSGTHWITLLLPSGLWSRYQPDKDRYRWSYSTWKAAESSWNRVARWTEEILSAHPGLDPQKVMYYQLGRLRRNAEEAGIPLSSLGFEGLDRIPVANGKTELGI